MAGQIIKRGDKTWLVRIFTGRDAQGKRRYLNKTVRGNKKDAETYLSTTLTAMSAGTFVAASPLTVREYLTRWLETAASKRVRERTFSDYSELLKRYVYPSIGDVRLSDLRPLQIQALYSQMIAPKLKKDEMEVGGPVALAYRHARCDTLMLSCLPHLSKLSSGSCLHRTLLHMLISLG